MRLTTSPDYQGDVRKWQALFCPDQNSDEIGFPSQNVIDLRMRLICEECGELVDATDERNIVKVADALADLLYVVFGTVNAFGFDMTPVWNEVQRSNIAKLGPDGKPIRREDGKVIKPPYWQPPNIEQALEEAQINE